MGRRDGERGAIAIMAVLLIAFVVGAFMALATNLGLLMETRTELQRASDSAALAAAGSLNGTPVGLGVSRLMASSFSSAHTVTRESVIIDEQQDVVFGRWHRIAGSCVFSSGRCGPGFEAARDPVADAFAITAVQAGNGRDLTGRHNTPVPTLFGGAFLERRANEVGSRAVAIGPGALTGCSLPFLLPTCMLVQPGGPPCGTPLTLHYGQDTRDGVGLVNLIDAKRAPNPANLPDMIRESCLEPVWVGDYRFGNGNDVNQKVLEALLGTDGSGSCHVGTPQLFPVADVGCPNPKFSGSGTLLRFVSATVVQVTDNQGTAYDARSCGTGTPASGGATKGGGPKRSITLQLDCDANGGFGAGSSELVLRLVE